MHMHHVSSTRSRTLSIVAIAAAAGIALAACSSGSSSDPSTPSPKTPQTTADPTQPTTGGQIGKPITLGSFTYTVESVKNVGKNLTSDEGESMAQGSFVVVTMTVKNNGKSKQKLKASNFSAETANAQAVQAQENDTIIANGADPSFRDGIAPGQTATVKLAFDFVPPPTTPVTKVVIKDPASTKSVVIDVT